MKYLLILSTLLSLNLVASPKCDHIHITDSCHITGGLIIKEFQIELLCELQNGHEVKRIVEFDSLRSEKDCNKFEKTISANRMSLGQLDTLIEDSSPFSKAKIKTIGSDLPSRDETTRAQMNWMRSVKQSMNKSASEKTSKRTSAQIQWLESMRKSANKKASERAAENTAALVRKLKETKTN